MAAVIPEAAEAVGSGTSAVRGAARHARSRARPAAAARNREAAVASSQYEGSQRQERRSRARQQQQIKRTSQRVGRGVLKARVPGSYSYQPVILAEFLVAVVIVSVSPLAKGGTPEAQTKGSPSPYSVNTLKQLVAIGGVYFVLAIVARSNRLGRFAGWFGGLVLVGLGLAEYLSGDLQALFGIFGPSATATPGGNLGGGLGQYEPLPTDPFATPVQNATGIFPTISPSGNDAGLGQYEPNVQNINFAQPGVATTTETSPGVTITPGIDPGTGILGPGGVTRSPAPGAG